jgi:multimeric flavodoxin WrbA
VKCLLIVYHSMTGGTLQMAEAAAAGARKSALRVSLVRAVDAHASDVLRAEGFIFATPENLAAISGKMKDFFDRTYYSVLDRIN